jgi:hypothetical protein
MKIKDVNTDPELNDPDQSIRDEAILRRVAVHGICDSDDLAAVERDNEWRKRHGLGERK